MALQRLREAAERAKVELSTLQQTEVNLPFITADASGPKHLSRTLTRAKLEQLTQDLIERTIPPMRAALGDAKYSKDDIDEVLLVGGQTRMPAVQRTVQQFFGKEPHKGINPDEVVAIGAAIQAGVLGGDVKDVLLLDVTPLTLSIETLGGVATPLIERNTTIPVRKTETFSTASDNQTQVEINVLQGERPLAAQNKSLGRFILDGIAPAPRGLPQIEVSFDIDANGIVNVSARDKTTGKEQKVTITASSGLSEAEIQQMVQDAELHAEEDRRRRETIELRNQADTMAFQAEKVLQEHGDKVPADTKAEVEAKLAAVREVLDKDPENAERLRSSYEELTQALSKIGQIMYEQAAAQQGEPAGATAGADGSGQAREEGTVEGEFREVPHE